MRSPDGLPPDRDGASQAKLVELQRRVEELTSAVAARDTFIAVASHELRNPMTPMIGHIELVLNGVRSGRYSLRQVEERLERVRMVMNQYLKRAATLLDVSRITTGKLRLEPSPVDLCVVTREIVEAFAAAARHASAPITVDAPESLLGTWDRLAIEQIIDNLVSNAIKYGNHQPIDIVIECVNDTVSIRVQDRGPGISVENRTRIFERFERAVGSNEPRSGFGVGLWVVGQLVDAMGGTISVADAQGGGSVFTVILPRHVHVTCV